MGRGDIHYTCLCCYFWVIVHCDFVKHFISFHICYFVLGCIFQLHVISMYLMIGLCSTNIYDSNPKPN